MNALVHSGTDARRHDFHWKLFRMRPTGQPLVQMNCYFYHRFSIIIDICNTNPLLNGLSCERTSQPPHNTHPLRTSSGNGRVGRVGLLLLGRTVPSGRFLTFDKVTNPIDTKKPHEEVAMYSPTVALRPSHPPQTRSLGLCSLR